MSKAIRTTLSLVVALVLFSAVTMAQAAANTKNTENKEHHSRLAKAAFWRHKDANENAKQTKPTQASKQSHAKAAQLKPASAKVSGKKDQQGGSKANKPTAKTAPAASKTKPQPKA
jgi:hypothetical protein